MPGYVIDEMQCAWNSDAMSRLKRVTAAGIDISKGIARLVDASLKAAILSQKDIACSHRGPVIKLLHMLRYIRSVLVPWGKPLAIRIDFREWSSAFSSGIKHFYTSAHWRKDTADDQSSLIP